MWIIAKIIVCFLLPYFLPVLWNVEEVFIYFIAYSVKIITKFITVIIINYMLNDELGLNQEKYLVMSNILWILLSFWYVYNWKIESLWQNGHIAYRLTKKKKKIIWTYIGETSRKPTNWNSGTDMFFMTSGLFSWQRVCIF